MSIEEKIEADNRSVYVGNVDYGATAEELEQHFHGCGSINRYVVHCITLADVLAVLCTVIIIYLFLVNLLIVFNFSYI